MMIINYKRILLSVGPAAGGITLMTIWTLFKGGNMFLRGSPIFFWGLILFFILCNVLIVALVKTYRNDEAYVSILEKHENNHYISSLQRILSAIFPFFFLLLVVGIYLYKPFYLIFDSPEYTAPDYKTSKFNWLLSNLIITIFSLLLIILISAFIQKDKFKLCTTEKGEKIFVITIVVLHFILIFINKLALFTDNVTFDNVSVRMGANGIMTTGSIPEGTQNYLQTFSNNRGIILLLGVLGRIANIFSIPHRLLWILVDSIFITLAVLFVYLTIRLFCSQKIRLIVLSLTAAFLVFSPCITPLSNTGADWYTCYTDTASMPFTTISAYFFVRFFISIDKGYKNHLLVFCGSLSASIGSLFKPTAFITVIAFVLILLLTKKEPRIRKTLMHMGLVIMGICIILIPFNRIYDRYDTIKSTTPPVSTIHYLIMGMLNTGQNINENGTLVFNDQPSLDPFKDRGRWNYAESGFSKSQVLKARIQTMNIALLGFYYLKDVNNLSFTYDYSSANFSMNSANDSYYKTPFLDRWRAELLKIQIPVRAVIWNLMFWQIALWAFIVIKKRISYLSFECFLSTAMLGIFAYLTFFESGDRYPMQFWPIFLIISSLGFMRLKVLKGKT